jgi:ATP-dependent DNA helicase RecG
LVLSFFFGLNPTVLTQPCENIPGVGPSLAAKLAKCGIKTAQDLLFHLPYRYQDRTRVTPIQDLRSNEWCVVTGYVRKTEIKYGKRPMLNCYIEDKTGILRLRFFHFNKQQAQKFNEAPFIRAFGEIREYGQQFEMVHPEYQLLNNESEFSVEETLTPIYPTTQGLTQTRIRQLVNGILTSLKEDLQQLEWMSSKQLEKFLFQPLAVSLECLHNPTPDISLDTLEDGSHPALQRLAFDELLAQRLSLQFARKKRAKLSAPLFPCNPELQAQFLQNLPFSLTSAQQRVLEEISIDLAQDKPMLRLVQGDVGAGKTVIAALAALHAIANGHQVAFMAPTDILSEQHASVLQRWLEPLQIKVGRLSGKMKVSERKKVLTDLAEHNCQLIVGTHALFQEKVIFARLGLVIIDEQHRFGVEQRLLLQQKGEATASVPHQLLMTATPIPRTLAMTQFAHLDLSIIDELPPGRVPVITAVINQEKRQTIVAKLQNAIATGRQVYWVCTLIEDSEKLQCIAATATAQSLQEQLTGVRVGLIHGRMKAAQKDEIMLSFKSGALDLLVATTVIEVGVDVPNASLMIIENAERLGLSQLHQLRGRVGRGNSQSHCLLLYQTPLSTLGIERLRVMKETNDGFVIAEKDLQLRGSGELLGSRQTGYRQYKIANPQRDHAVLKWLSPVAEELIAHNPNAAREISQRWLGEYEHFLQG